jgi:starch synthase
MKVALSAIGKFHTFDLARELHARGVLAGVTTAYPRFKLRNEGIPEPLISTFPWIYAPYLAMPGKNKLPRQFSLGWQYLSTLSFGVWAAARLPECDVYVGLSGSALIAGRKAQRLGAKFICDRGSSHIREQDELLREEHEIWGTPFPGIDPRVIDREETEYTQADAITVPSQFVLRSFLKRGVPQDKLRLLPYGVNLSRFQPVAKPAEGRFDVLFVGGMSLRKGIQYIVQAYSKLSHPAKSLTFVGTPSQELIDMLRARKLWPEDARVLGHMPQTQLKELMSRSHVLVLASVEEGLAMVQAQAMACACPVVATTNTGCEDLFSDGVEGYITPVRSPDIMAARLQELADQPEARERMSLAALARVKSIGGWADYGSNAINIYAEAIL